MPTDYTDLEIAQLELDSGRPQLAIQFAQYAATENPDDHRSWNILAAAAMRCGDYAIAVDAFEHLALCQPMGMNARISMAIAYGGIGRRSLSRDLLMAAVQSSPNAEHLLRIATGLEALDEPQLAMEACRRAGRKAPEAAEVYYQMAYYASQCGHPASTAEALMRHAVELEPGSLHYRIGLSSLLIRLDRKDEAVKLIDNVVPQRLLEVTCRCCLKRIANLFFDLGDLSRAKLCAEQIATLDHQPAEATKTSA